MTWHYGPQPRECNRANQARAWERIVEPFRGEAGIWVGFCLLVGLSSALLFGQAVAAQGLIRAGVEAVKDTKIISPASEAAEVGFFPFRQSRSCLIDGSAHGFRLLGDFGP